MPWDPLSSPGQQGDLHTYTTWSYSSKTSKAFTTATCWKKKDIIKKEGYNQITNKCACIFMQNKNKILQTILVNDSWKRFLQVMLDGRLFPPSLLSHFWNEERIRPLKTCQWLFFIWWIKKKIVSMRVHISVIICTCKMKQKFIFFFIFF